MSASELGKSKTFHNEQRMPFMSEAHDIMSASELGKSKTFHNERRMSFMSKAHDIDIMEVSGFGNSFGSGA